MTMQRLEPHDFVAARLYASEGDVVQDALQHLLEDRPDLRIALAVYRYSTNEDLTLATAAALAGISSERMKAELMDRGVELRLGSASIEDARAEVAAMKRLHRARTD